MMTKEYIFDAYNYNMKCPKCHELMTCIVHESLTNAKWEARYICKCGGYIQFQYDKYEE